MAKPKCVYRSKKWHAAIGEFLFSAGTLASLVDGMIQSQLRQHVRTQQNIQNWETIQRKAVEWYRPSAPMPK